MTFDPIFKKALQLLPEEEKDKLILRLLKNNLKLANRLHFELVDTDSVEEKREQLISQIKDHIKTVSDRYHSPGYLMMDMREISGIINDHVSTTKDKPGEIVLNLLMLRSVLELNNKRIAVEKPNNSYTFCIYIISRMFKILILMQKQHKDLHIEFRDDIESIGNLIGSNPNLMKTAIQNGLDVNWLISFDIPENIAESYKELRDNGFLR